MWLLWTLRLLRLILGWLCFLSLVIVFLGIYSFLHLEYVAVNHLSILLWGHVGSGKESVDARCCGSVKFERLVESFEVVLQDWGRFSVPIWSGKVADGTHPQPNPKEPSPIVFDVLNTECGNANYSWNLTALKSKGCYHARIEKAETVSARHESKWVEVLRSIYSWGHMLQRKAKRPYIDVETSILPQATWALLRKEHDKHKNISSSSRRERRRAP